MLKLYKRIDGTLHYREAWANENSITEHWGLVGERGDSREHACSPDEEPDDAIARLLQPALDDGYAPIDSDDQAILLIEYAIDGMGSDKDLKKRHALQDRMDETLGWTGLGSCDGGGSGSGTMDVCCFVVDFEIARRVIEADLKGTRFADYTRIYREE